MDVLIAGFIEFKKTNEGRAERTGAAYTDILYRFRDWLAGRDPCACTEDELLVFTGLHLNKAFGLHARSRVPYVACIRGFYAWLDRCGYLGDFNPAENLPYPKAGKPLPRVISLGHLEALIAQPDLGTFEGVRDAAMISLIAGCGFRLAGLVALNRSCLVEYELKKQKRLALRVLEKGDKERLQPVPREAELLLRVYLEHPLHEHIDAALPNGDRPMWISTRNSRIPAHEFHGDARRLSHRGVQEMIRRYGIRAGVPEADLHPHSLRHRFGTELTESDVPLDQTGDLLGHSSHQSTLIYLHLAINKRTASVDRANPLSKIRTPASELLRRLDAQQRPPFTGPV
ncbi:Tyrosine recombinase XerD [Andreprevotia sp. IGB-42]|uniref:tyrosine-type recombinase/integrase n=1 Tax=Andreprevotia sp. IGB-42 TaxID=2497473 RepID=UPI00135A4CDD|nr:tyrosine-type recombinase/integrase [Andreprevotia sp. IGB-42]KAF0812815.1 Tyrosine recombinase XerD [Andreprevotia sp. IGB-42]